MDFNVIRRRRKRWLKRFWVQPFLLPPFPASHPTRSQPMVRRLSRISSEIKTTILDHIPRRSMAPRSRLEIDFERLLNKCESDIAAQSDVLSPKSWRLVKYVECLEDKLSELHKLTTCQPSRDRLTLFKRRVKLLRGLVDAEKLKSASEKLTATEILSPRTSSTQDKSRIKTQEIFLQTKSKYNREVRDELFNGGKENTPRKRFDGASGNKNDADLVLNFHHEMQEKVAAEMITLARNLKENLYLANDIIKKDVEVLDDSARVADSNTIVIRTNSDRLSDFVRRSCQYWLWISLGLVCFTFLWIIVFIRMFPKKVVYHQV